MGSDSTIQAISLVHASGAVVEGEALVSIEGFSPRYDLDRWTGEISRPGHDIEGENIKDKVLIVPVAKGGIAAGWAFHDLKTKGIAPKAFVFGVVNPVMVQGAIFAGIPIASGWDQPPYELISTGNRVRLNPQEKKLEILSVA